MAGLSVRDRVRSSNIQRKLSVEPLLHGVKRSQMRWFRHLIRVPLEHLPLEVLDLNSRILGACHVFDLPAIRD